MDESLENMEEMESSFIMTDEEGNEVEFFIVDEIEDNGVTYLLLTDSAFDEDEDVADDEEDESEAIILKEVPGEGDEAVYEVIEDDAEFERIAEIFAQRSEDYDIEL